MGSTSEAHKEYTASALRKIQKRMHNPRSPFYGWKLEELDPETIYPWTDVLTCSLDKDQTPFMHRVCPHCEKEGEHSLLVIIDFRSPDWTWGKLVGTAGPLTICSKHKRQVDFFPSVVS